MRIGTKIGKTFVSYGKSGVYISRWIGGVRVSHFEPYKKKLKHKDRTPTPKMSKAELDEYTQKEIDKVKIGWKMGLVIAFLTVLIIIMA